MKAIVVASQFSKSADAVVSLQASGCEVDLVSSGPELVTRLLQGQAPGVVAVDSDLSDGSGVQLCAEIQRRFLGISQPEVLLLGTAHSDRQSLHAFEAGVSNWLDDPAGPALGQHVRFARRIQSLGADDCYRNRAILQLEQLASDAEGILEVTDGVVTVDVWVRRGRIGYCRVRETDTPFSAVVFDNAHMRCQDVDALRQAQGYPVHNWRSFLVDHGLWERARFRDALGRRWEHMLRWVAASDVCDVRFVSTEVRFAEELGFEPSDLLADLEPRAPRSFVRGALNAAQVANDTLLADVS